MKKVSVAMMVFTASMLMASGVLAHDKHAYIGLNYYSLSQDIVAGGIFENEGDDFATGELMVRFGGHVMPWLAMEWRAGRTIKSYEVDDADYLHRYFWGIYAKLGRAFGPVYPYLLGGYTRGEGVYSDDQFGTLKARFGELSFGLGVDFDLTDSIGLNLEYFHVYEIGDVGLSGPGAGVFWRF